MWATVEVLAEGIAIDGETVGAHGVVIGAADGGDIGVAEGLAEEISVDRADATCPEDESFLSHAGGCGE